MPEGALKLYFEAVFCYIDEATRSEGAKMLRYAMHLDRPLEQAGSYATFVSRMQDPDENYVFRSFAAGTSPQNGYHMSKEYGGLWYTINNAGTSQVRAPQSQIERHKNAHDADFDTVVGC